MQTDELRDILAFELAAKRIEIHYLLAHLGQAGLLSEEQIAEYCSDVSEALSSIAIKPTMQKVRDKAVNDYAEMAATVSRGTEIVR